MPQYSDDELRAMTDKTKVVQLTVEQRKRRRRLRRQDASARVTQRRLEHGATELTQCTATSQRSAQRCRRNAIRGTDLCPIHTDNPLYADIGAAPVTYKAPELMKLAVEAAVEKVINKYFSGLGLRLEGFEWDEEGHRVPVIVDTGGGVMLHGESRDGEIVMTDYENIMAQVEIAEKLINRVYGKPKQTTQIEGGVQPIKVLPVRTEERAREVAELLSRSAAIPQHEGRQRRSHKPTEGSDARNGDKG